MDTMNVVSQKEFQQHLAKYSQRVQKGESFVVLKHAKPAMKIVPATAADESGSADIAQWTERFIEQYRPALERLAKE